MQLPGNKNAQIVEDFRLISASNFELQLAVQLHQDFFKLTGFLDGDEFTVHLNLRTLSFSWY